MGNEISAVIDKIKQAVEADKHLSVGLIFDVKETTIPNNCYRVFRATVQVTALLDAQAFPASGCPEYKDETPFITLEEPAEHFALHFRDITGRFGMPLAVVHIPTEILKYCKQPFEVTVRAINSINPPTPEYQPPHSIRPSDVQ